MAPKPPPSQGSKSVNLGVHLSKGHNVLEVKHTCSIVQKRSPIYCRSVEEHCGHSRNGDWRTLMLLRPNRRYVPVQGLSRSKQNKISTESHRTMNHRLPSVYCRSVEEHCGHSRNGDWRTLMLLRPNRRYVPVHGLSQSKQKKISTESHRTMNHRLPSVYSRASHEMSDQQLIAQKSNAMFLRPSKKYVPVLIKRQYKRTQVEKPRSLNGPEVVDTTIKSAVQSKNTELQGTSKQTQDFVGLTSELENSAALETTHPVSPMDIFVPDQCKMYASKCAINLSDSQSVRCDSCSTEGRQNESHPIQSSPTSDCGGRPFTATMHSPACPSLPSESATEGSAVSDARSGMWGTGVKRKQHAQTPMPMYSRSSRKVRTKRWNGIKHRPTNVMHLRPDKQYTSVFLNRKKKSSHISLPNVSESKGRTVQDKSSAISNVDRTRGTRRSRKAKLVRCLNKRVIKKTEKQEAVASSVAASASKQDCHDNFQEHPSVDLTSSIRPILESLRMDPATGSRDAFTLPERVLTLRPYSKYRPLVNKAQGISTGHCLLSKYREKSVNVSHPVCQVSVQPFSDAGYSPNNPNVAKTSTFNGKRQCEKSSAINTCPPPKEQLRISDSDPTFTGNREQHSSPSKGIFSEHSGAISESGRPFQMPSKDTPHALNTSAHVVNSIEGNDDVDQLLKQNSEDEIAEERLLVIKSSSSSIPSIRDKTCAVINTEESPRDSGTCSQDVLTRKVMMLQPYSCYQSCRGKSALRDITSRHYLLSAKQCEEFPSATCTEQPKTIPECINDCQMLTRCIMAKSESYGSNRHCLLTTGKCPPSSYANDRNVSPQGVSGLKRSTNQSLGITSVPSKTNSIAFLGRPKRTCKSVFARPQKDECQNLPCDLGQTKSTPSKILDKNLSAWQPQNPRTLSQKVTSVLSCKIAGDKETALAKQKRLRNVCLDIQVRKSVLTGDDSHLPMTITGAILNVDECSREHTADVCDRNDDSPNIKDYSEESKTVTTMSELTVEKATCKNISEVCNVACQIIEKDNSKVTIRPKAQLPRSPMKLRKLDKHFLYSRLGFKKPRKVLEKSEKRTRMTKAGKKSTSEAFKLKKISNLKLKRKTGRLQLIVRKCCEAFELKTARGKYPLRKGNINCRPSSDVVLPSKQRTRNGSRHKQIHTRNFANVKTKQKCQPFNHHRREATQLRSTNKVHHRSDKSIGSTTAPNEPRTDRCTMLLRSSSRSLPNTRSRELATLAGSPNTNLPRVDGQIQQLQKAIPDYASSLEDEDFTLEEFCSLKTLEEAIEWAAKANSAPSDSSIDCELSTNDNHRKRKQPDLPCFNHSASSKKRRMKRSSRSPEGSYWDCSVCTYRNKAEAFKCAMCDVRKGTSTRKPRLNAQLVAQQQAQQNLSPLLHVKPAKQSQRGSTQRKAGTSKKPRPRLKNVDRSSAVTTEVVVNNVPVIITEYKEKAHTRTTVDSDDMSTSDRTNGNINGL